MRTKQTKQSILTWFKISRIYSENIRESNRLLKDYDLSLAQFDVIAQIGVGKEITQSELSTKLLVSKGNISQLITSMENKGLVTRRPDWKTKYVCLTESGTKLHDTLVPLMEEFQTETFGILDDKEREELIRLLRKVGRREKKSEEEIK